MADHRSVARSAVKNVVRRDQHSRTRHILDDSGGFARNVLSEVARDKPSVSIVSSTGGTADDELNCFALVKILDRGRHRRRDRRYQNKDSEQKYSTCLRHEP